ncbi:hypothetical protein JHK82_020384 [Glycine max]|uniref:Uncharacterized protein n=2 Tax=Glycine subgen. Soja TaxID=1462606 RepID=K7L4S9_SOYBN|nr:hypothetical protein JHK85_020838 [Glycine max]KAG5024485.1 hypothetical protein JHK86_020399 [Glycine max]KAG5135653.1 hypothetical protein JHK82_020384 [Glycine max]KAH1049507.1 hypothetical protein GYH30_020161 [Glycine max]RZB95125.1 hypothetical protein D0Y65_019536 [Glycine soja]
MPKSNVSKDNVVCQPCRSSKKRTIRRKTQKLPPLTNSHPRKDNSSISSLAWRRRKLLGGHCECLEKQALGFIIIGVNQNVTQNAKIQN